MGFGNVLDNNRDVEVPRPDGLVIRGRNEAAILVNKRDGIHGA